MYVIYDTKVEAFHKPFHAQADGEAMRMINEAMNDENTMFAKYPGDYQLYHMGTFDDSTGKVETGPLADLGNLAIIRHLVEKERKQQKGEKDEISNGAPI